MDRIDKKKPLFLDSTAGHKVNISFNIQMIKRFAPKLLSDGLNILKALENSHWSYWDASPPALY